MLLRCTARDFLRLASAPNRGGGKGPGCGSLPRPSAGVGGTRRGVKCLHAHYAWYLAGGDDPVGRWVAERFAAYEDRDDLPEDHHHD